MKQSVVILFLISMMLVSACDPQADSEADSTAKDSLPSIDSATHWSVRDTLTMLFEQARTTDSTLYDHWRPFVYFKSGRFLVEDVATALVMVGSTDSTVKMQLWSLHMDIWTQQSEVELEGPGIAFDVVFDDYNFDGQTDIYNAVTCSNGYALSRGHLVTINPYALAFGVHPEARDLCNIAADPKSKTVFSDAFISCQDGRSSACKWTNKWIDGKLTTVHKSCPCDAE